MSVPDAVEAPQTYYSAPIRGASAAASPSWAQFVDQNSVHRLQFRVEKRCLDRLSGLQESWDGHGSAAPDREVIDWVYKNVLPDLYEEVSALGRTWMTPHFTASESGEVVMEWWNGKRKITLYASPRGLEYIKVRGVNIENEMDYGRLPSAQDFRSIWTWLYA